MKYVICVSNAIIELATWLEVIHEISEDSFEKVSRVEYHSGHYVPMVTHEDKFVTLLKYDPRDIHELFSTKRARWYSNMRPGTEFNSFNARDQLILNKVQELMHNYKIIIEK